MKMYLNFFPCSSNPWIENGPKAHEATPNSVNILNKKSEQIEISSFQPNPKWRLVGQTAAVGLAVLLTGIWVGRLAYSNNNEFMLWDKGLQNPDAIKESLHVELQKQAQNLKVAEDLNKELLIKLNVVQKMDLNNKVLIQYSKNLNASLIEEDKKIQILNKEYPLTQADVTQLKNKITEIQIESKDCSELLNNFHTKVKENKDLQEEIQITFDIVKVISVIALSVISIFCVKAKNIEIETQKLLSRSKPIFLR